jgi:hypothetical protein
MNVIRGAALACDVRRLHRHGEAPRPEATTAPAAKWAIL